MRTTSASRPPATAGNLESVPAPQSRGDCVLQPKATQSHINATSKPPQCVLIANRLRPKPVSLPWGNGGGTVGEPWGKATNSPCLSGCFPNVNLRPCLCCANQPPVPDVAPGLHAAFP